MTNREPKSDCIIRPLRQSDVDTITEIAALAWTPIFERFHCDQLEAIGEVGRPSSLERKRQEVRQFAESHPNQILVTECNGKVVAFITFTFDRDRAIGVIGNNAVHPGQAGRGLGAQQYRKVLDVFHQQGMRYALVQTGLDPAHAPARRAYEKVGFKPVASSVDYMMKL